MSTHIPMGAPAPTRRRPPLSRLVPAALVLALVVPGAISPTSASASTSAMTATEKSWSNAVLSMMNSERKAHGVAALTERATLLTSARRHDLTMARYNKMSHQLPGELPFDRRIEAAGYTPWTYLGENIGWNADVSCRGVKALESVMYNEKAPNDGHRLNILNRHYANVGIDVYIDSVHHKVWLTEDFGHH